MEWGPSGRLFSVLGLFKPFLLDSLDLKEMATKATILQDFGFVFFFSSLEDIY